MVLALAGDALACTCAPVDLVRDLPRADGAFVGTLLERTEAGETATLHFRVEQVYKGDFSGRIEVDRVLEAPAAIESPPHVSHPGPSGGSEIVSNTSHTKSGVVPKSAKKPKVRRDALSPASSRYSENAAKKQNAPRPNSEMGMPPQYWSFSSAEYGLYMAARHASASVTAPAPGMKLQ